MIMMTVMGEYLEHDGISREMPAADETGRMQASELPLALLGEGFRP
jgi:hypothetical protein